MKNNPIDLIRSARYRLKHKTNVFPYYGFEVYFGKYGSGKTLTCVFKSQEILSKYKDVVFITNTAISGVGNETHFFESADDLVNILLSIDFSHPAYGYLIFVDEIAVIFKDLFYSSYCKDFVTFLTQVRKLRYFFYWYFTALEKM